MKDTADRENIFEPPAEAVELYGKISEEIHNQGIPHSLAFERGGVEFLFEDGFIEIGFAFLEYLIATRTGKASIH